MNPEFKNKNYLILGAANGMGKTLARDLAECKANLFLVDIDPALKKVCAALSKKTKCSGYIGDLTDYQQVIDRALEMIKDKGFDGIVYFVRGRQHYAYADFDQEKWESDLRLNLESQMYLIHQLWSKKKINQDAGIVLLSSSCTKYGDPQSHSYIMSKAALESMGRCLALELGPSRIRINTVQLGFIVKDEHKSRFYSKDNQEYRFWAETLHPLGRVGHNDDVVGPIKFLLSKQSSFITGQILCIDGGIGIQEPGFLVQKFMRVR